MLTCSNCGFQNEDTAKFCVKCGSPINLPESAVVPQPAPVQGFGVSSETVNPFNANSQPIQSPVVSEAPAQTTVQPQYNTVQNQRSGGKLNPFSFIANVLLKPATTMREEFDKFEDTKTSIVFAVIVSLIAMVAGLIQAIYYKVYTPASNGYFGYGKREASWDWGNIGSVNWGDAIFKNLLIYLGALFAIALVYFLASLIIKKNANFRRLLGLASVSALPVFLCSLVISPLVAIVYAPLGIIISLVGVMYGLVLFMSYINKEMSLEDGDGMIFTNLVCLSILACAGYYLFEKLFVAAVTASTVMNLFN